LIIENEDDVTKAVLHAMAGDKDQRRREVAQAFVRHIHAFLREVKLTEKEYEKGLEILNSIGTYTNDSHNEAVLFCDALGISTLICLMNNGQSGATETAAALLGPFWRMQSPITPSGGSIVRSPTPGEALFADLHVVDKHGKPLEGVEVDVWHSSPVGLYENQDPNQAEMNLRGKFFTDANGHFSFRSTKPAGYPIPVDTATGDMLRAQHRHPYRPAHLHFLLYKKGYKTLVTQIFVDDDQYLDSDVVFGVTRALVGDYKKHSDNPPAPDVSGPWYKLDYRFMMEEGEASLPQPPIK
jgi:catechol 1,2-dioxygenase